VTNYSPLLFPWTFEISTCIDSLLPFDEAKYRYCKELPIWSLLEELLTVLAPTHCRIVLVVSLVVVRTDDVLRRANVKLFIFEFISTSVIDSSCVFMIDCVSYKSLSNLSFAFFVLCLLLSGVRRGVSECVRWCWVMFDVPCFFFFDANLSRVRGERRGSQSSICYPKRHHQPPDKVSRVLVGDTRRHAPHHFSKNWLHTWPFWYR
jgi:hypothetical protein